MTVTSQTQSDIQQAAEILKNGGLVAFPTETVYGLGADATNPKALARLYATKGRPASHPVIVHLADFGQIEDWAVNIPETARLLAEAFWPGPMTLILQRAPHVLDAITGGQDTVGLRIPRHPMALGLLKHFDGGIAAPSANRFGQISPTTAQHVRDDLGEDVDWILDGGACDVGVESTIIDLSSDTPKILRPGMILESQLEDLLGLSSLSQPQTNLDVRVPGTLASHYAPHTPVQLLSSEILESTITEALAKGLRVVTYPHQTDIAAQRNLVVFPAPGRPEDYAKSLYRQLRQMDRLGCDMMLIEAVPDAPAWSAIQDRLMRAAAPRPENFTEIHHA